MKILTFVTAKGGAGKSTLAASIGVAAAESGEKVFLIDLDPQGSLASWGNRRQADEPAVDRIGPDKLPAALAGLANAGYTLAIIDTAGVDTPGSLPAMRLADLALIPARPSALDIEAARPTMAALERLRRSYAFVMNACPPGKSARLEDAGRALSLLGILAAPPIVHRAGHMDAMALGLGITEHDPNGKGADEIRALWHWVKRRTEKMTDVQASVA